MAEIACRFCRGTAGELVLDLGAQPACDYFPPFDDPRPGSRLSAADVAMLGVRARAARRDPTVPGGTEGPRSPPPSSRRRSDADRTVSSGAGWLHPGANVLEYGSPHGGSWLPIGRCGSRPVAVACRPIVRCLDCFGLMHCADQAAAVAERAARLAPGGVLLIQYHSLATIIERGQWNSLRHGHYAYYSATALAAMLEPAVSSPAGLDLRPLWRHCSARRDRAAAGSHAPDTRGRSLLAAEQRLGVRRAAGRCAGCRPPPRPAQQGCTPG